jgi:predicted DNA-binding ribbon-helix-helix protein
LIAQTNEDFANLPSAIRVFVLRYYRDKLDRQEAMVLSPTAPHLAAPVNPLVDWFVLMLA